MFKSEIAFPQTHPFEADKFELKAKEFAELAEEAKTAEECARYRDIELEWQMRATAARLRQIAA